MSDHIKTLYRRRLIELRDRTAMQTVFQVTNGNIERAKVLADKARAANLKIIRMDAGMED